MTTHKPDCQWEKTKSTECEYRETHEYCPHPEHACTCPPLEKGQQTLVADLEALLAEAKAGEFGDFSNEKYAAPKMALAEKLNELRQNTINGKYD